MKLPLRFARRALAWLVGMGLGVAVAGCDTELDPFVESDLHFSIFGFLDAAADTQYVRISPVREGLLLGPAPLDAVVTLNDAATGRRVILRDSVFRIGDRFVHNFWTDARLDHEATYRLVVQGTADAARTSTATTTLPANFPDPIFILPPGQMAGLTSIVAGITVPEVTQLAELSLVLTPREPLRAGVAREPIVFSLLDRVALIGGDLGVGLRPYVEVFGALGACPSFERAEVRVAAAGPGWPPFATLDDETLALPDVLTNVEDGVGFLGGVSRRVLAWDALLGFLAGTQAACEQCLRFASPTICFR